MLSCKMILSLNGQSPIECLPITSEAPLSLCGTGVTEHDLAAARLELDGHNELVVIKTADIPVQLERAGRKMQLREGKPIRICEKDTLWIADTAISIVKSTFVMTRSASRSSFIRTAQKVLAASAAVFSMVAFTSCDEDNGCENGQQKCKNNAVYVCTDGSWALHEKCDIDATCIESENLTAYCEVELLGGDPLPPDCETGEMKCDDKDVLKCDGGLWSKVETCEESCHEESNTSALGIRLRAERREKGITSRKPTSPQSSTVTHRRLSIHSFLIAIFLF